MPIHDTATPPATGVSAQLMSPVAAAGVDLAKFVLRITAGAIVLLLLYLITMEWMVGSDVRQAYARILSASRVGAESIASERLARFTSDLNQTRQDPAQPWSSESTQNAQEMLTLLDSLPSVTTAQVAQLKECAGPPPATDTSRNTKLDACVALLGGLRQATLQAAGLAPDAQVASESANRIHDQRQSLHTFWVQAAQLVLLNLLLPLLTALFGYVFGTQQSQQKVSES